MLDGFVDLAPPPQPRATQDRQVLPEESNFSGFVFKIRANMDPIIEIVSPSYVFALRLSSGYENASPAPTRGYQGR